MSLPRNTSDGFEGLDLEDLFETITVPDDIDLDINTDIELLSDGEVRDDEVSDSTIPARESRTEPTRLPQPDFSANPVPDEGEIFAAKIAKQRKTEDTLQRDSATGKYHICRLPRFDPTLRYRIKDEKNVFRLKNYSRRNGTYKLKNIQGEFAFIDPRSIESIDRGESQQKKIEILTFTLDQAREKISIDHERHQKLRAKYLSLKQKLKMEELNNRYAKEENRKFRLAGSGQSAVDLKHMQRLDQRNQMRIQHAQRYTQKMRETYERLGATALPAGHDLIQDLMSGIIRDTPQSDFQTGEHIQREPVFAGQHVTPLLAESVGIAAGVEGPRYHDTTRTSQTYTRNNTTWRRGTWQRGRGHHNY